MAGQSEPSLTLLPLIFDTEKAGNHESRHGGDLDLCHTVVILILPLPWEKQWQLWLNGSGRSSSEPTPRLGSDPKLRFYDWIWSRLRWVIIMIASLMFCLEKPRAAPGRWRQGREASVKAGSLQGGQSPDNNHKHRSPGAKKRKKAAWQICSCMIQLMEIGDGQIAWFNQKVVIFLF